MKNLIVTLLIIIPLFTFSQSYNFEVANNANTADVRAIIYQTNNSTCTPRFNYISEDTNWVYNSGGTWNSSSSTLYAYEIQICLWSSGACSNVGCTSGEDIINLGHGPGVYSGVLENCDTGINYDVTWTTSIACNDITVTIEDQ